MLFQIRTTVLHGALQDLLNLPSPPDSGHFSCPPTPSPALSSEPLPVLCHPSGTLFPTVGHGQSLFFPGPSTNVIVILVRSFLAVAFKDNSPLFWEAPFPFLRCPCNHLAKINEVHLCICIVCAFIMCCPSLEHKP